MADAHVPGEGLPAPSADGDGAARRPESKVPAGSERLFSGESSGVADGPQPVSDDQATVFVWRHRPRRRVCLVRYPSLQCSGSARTGSLRATRTDGPPEKILHPLEPRATLRHAPGTELLIPTPHPADPPCLLSYRT